MTWPERISLMEKSPENENASTDEPKCLVSSLQQTISIVKSSTSEQVKFQINFEKWLQTVSENSGSLSFARKLVVKSMEPSSFLEFLSSVIISLCLLLGLKEHDTTYFILGLGLYLILKVMDLVSFAVLFVYSNVDNRVRHILSYYGVICSMFDLVYEHLCFIEDELDLDVDHTFYKKFSLPYWRLENFHPVLVNALSQRLAFYPSRYSVYGILMSFLLFVYVSWHTFEVFHHLESAILCVVLVASFEKDFKLFVFVKHMVSKQSKIKTVSEDFSRWFECDYQCRRFFKCSESKDSILELVCGRRATLYAEDYSLNYAILVNFIINVLQNCKNVRRLDALVYFMLYGRQDKSEYEGNPFLPEDSIEDQSSKIVQQQVSEIDFVQNEETVASEPKEPKNEAIVPFEFSFCPESFSCVLPNAISTETPAATNDLSFDENLLVRKELRKALFKRRVQGKGFAGEEINSTQGVGPSGILYESLKEYGQISAEFLKLEAEKSDNCELESEANRESQMLEESSSSDPSFVSSADFNSASYTVDRNVSGSFIASNETSLLENDTLSNCQAKSAIHCIHYLLSQIHDVFRQSMNSELQTSSSDEGDSSHTKEPMSQEEFEKEYEKLLNEEPLDVTQLYCEEMRLLRNTCQEANDPANASDHLVRPVEEYGGKNCQLQPNTEGNYQHQPINRGDNQHQPKNDEDSGGVTLTHNGSNSDLASSPSSNNDEMGKKQGSVNLEQPCNNSDVNFDGVQQRCSSLKDGITGNSLELQFGETRNDADRGNCSLMSYDDKKFDNGSKNSTCVSDNATSLNDSFSKMDINSRCKNRDEVKIAPLLAHETGSQKIENSFHQRQEQKPSSDPASNSDPTSCIEQRIVLKGRRKLAKSRQKKKVTTSIPSGKSNQANEDTLGKDPRSPTANFSDFPKLSAKPLSNDRSSSSADSGKKLSVVNKVEPTLPHQQNCSPVSESCPRTNVLSNKLGCLADPVISNTSSVERLNIFHSETVGKDEKSSSCDTRASKPKNFHNNHDPSDFTDSGPQEVNSACSLEKLNHNRELGACSLNTDSISNRAATFQFGPSKQANIAEFPNPESSSQLNSESSDIIVQELHPKYASCPLQPVTTNFPCSTSCTLDERFTRINEYAATNRDTVFRFGQTGPSDAERRQNSSCISESQKRNLSTSGSASMRQIQSPEVSSETIQDNFESDADFIRYSRGDSSRFEKYRAMKALFTVGMIGKEVDAQPKISPKKRIVIDLEESDSEAVDANFGIGKNYEVSTLHWLSMNTKSKSSLIFVQTKRNKNAHLNFPNRKDVFQHKIICECSETGNSSDCLRSVSESSSFSDGSKKQERQNPSSVEVLNEEKEESKDSGSENIWNGTLGDTAASKANDQMSSISADSSDDENFRFHDSTSASDEECWDPVSRDAFNDSESYLGDSCEEQGGSINDSSTKVIHRIDHNPSSIQGKSMWNSQMFHKSSDQEQTSPCSEDSPVQDCSKPVKYSLKYENLSLDLLDPSACLTLRLVTEKEDEYCNPSPSFSQVVHSSLSGSVEDILHVPTVSTIGGQTEDEILRVAENFLNMSATPVDPEKEPSGELSVDDLDDADSRASQDTPTTVRDMMANMDDQECSGVSNSEDKDFKFETENLVLNYKPVPGSDPVEISYRKRRFVTKLTFKSRDKKLIVKTTPPR